MEITNRYISYKNDYIQLKNEIEEHKIQIGGMNNVFLDKTQFVTHHQKKYRKRRLNDFNYIYKKLKSHLKPTEKTNIDEKLCKKYISLHKKENQPLIKSIVDAVQHISFKEFYGELKKQISYFNDHIDKNKIKKYVFVIGVNNDGGSSSTDYNIFKSNIWVLLLGWKYLKIKPYDIMLNLNTAIRLYANELTNFLLMDDCSYSGSQLFNNVIKPASTELLYQKEDGYMIVDKNAKIYQPVQNQNKYCNIHLIIPYMSDIASNKVCEINNITGLNVIKYTSFIINSYGKIFDDDTIKKINKLYQKFYSYVDFRDLIPVFFDHKIADSVSTIDLILIKGQVLDSKKKLVFIKECQYDKNDPTKKDFDPSTKHFIQKKLYCPIPPYLNFQKILNDK